MNRVWIFLRLKFFESWRPCLKVFGGLVAFVMVVFSMSYTADYFKNELVFRLPDILHEVALGIGILLIASLPLTLLILLFIILYQITVETFVPWIRENWEDAGRLAKKEEYVLDRGKEE